MNLPEQLLAEQTRQYCERESNVMGAQAIPEAPMPPRPHSQKGELLLFVSLLIFELSLVTMAVAMYLQGERPFSVFLSSGTGMAFLCDIAAFLIAGGVITSRYLEHRRSPSRHFRLVVVTNLVTMLLILITGEIIVRAGSQSHLDGEAFMNVVLLPKNWEQAKHRYAQFLEKRRVGRALLDYDDQTGWTVGSNRYSREKGEGPYWSSAEGLRAPHEGFVYSKTEGKTDIAIIGDSFTFGDEVRYEETWGYKLNQFLGEEFRILNFGVPGYSLGQAYLRYEAAVRQWNPKIVILGFIRNDLIRTTLVYPFVSKGWSMPFSKPRLVLKDGELTIRNRPAVPPEEIFSKGSVSELPFLDYDRDYRARDWQKHWYYFSYLFRLFISLYPPWSADTSEEEIVPLNAEILRLFVRSVKQVGSIPLIVYFPKREDFNQPDSYLPLGKRMMQEVGLPYLDPMSCLLEVTPSLRFERGGHYTPQGNAAVAKCLVDAVREALEKTSDSRLIVEGRSLPKRSHALDKAVPDLSLVREPDVIAQGRTGD